MKAVILKRLCTALLLIPVVQPSPLFGADRPGGADSGLVVRTKAGLVRGVVEDNGTRAWRGIPFARPPVGELRWRPPRPPQPWEGIRDGSVAGPICPQISNGEVRGDEDCLTLDIWRPAGKARNLPVYVWIHGGGNVTGGGRDLGATLAATSNVVVVMAQYRLGPLGFISHPSLRTGEHPRLDSGNFGTLDNIRALRWIRRNIAAFGGNPRNILLTGESAGAHNSTNLIISPLARGLFHKAQLQSGGMRTISRDEGDARDAVIPGALSQLLEETAPEEGPALAAWLRAQSAADLVRATAPAGGSSEPRSAVRDGRIVPGVATELIRAGRYNRVPVILGTNAHEISLLLPGYGLAIKHLWQANPAAGVTVPIPSGNHSWADLRGVIGGALTKDELLPEPVDKAVFEAVRTYGSLEWRMAFGDDLARALRSQQRRVWVYLFEWDGPDEAVFASVYGASHATEIPFFFGYEQGFFGGISFNALNDTPGRQELGRSMMAYTANLAHRGNPNGRDLPHWQPWSAEKGGPKVLKLDADEEKAQITMSDEEITQDTLDATFARLYMSLPESMRNVLVLFDAF